MYIFYIKRITTVDTSMYLSNASQIVEVPPVYNARVCTKF